MHVYGSNRGIFKNPRPSTCAMVQIQRPCFLFGKMVKKILRNLWQMLMYLILAFNSHISQVKKQKNKILMLLCVMGR